jgi:predicted AlkP superfamily pyrophosphatase or phosphodiesterase
MDGLHPAYLGLNAVGDGPGADGDWLMPNVRRFLARAAWFTNAKDYLPSITDPNQLNAVTGSYGGQTGILGVGAQLMGWDESGLIVAPTSLSFARDGLGRRVDTLFHAWKRVWPNSKTAYISGKAWVAEMFRGEGVIDAIVTGRDHPCYLPDPTPIDYPDPPTDPDARCDQESVLQRLNMATVFSRFVPQAFPPDEWVVNAALATFEYESPDLAFILLAEVDDTSHALGAAWDPARRVTAAYPQRNKCFCPDDPLYPSATRENPLLFVTPILDAIRNCDFEFGRLIDGLEAQGVLSNAMVILLSDHGVLTHLRSPNVLQEQQELTAATDYYHVLLNAGLGDNATVTPWSASGFAAVYYRTDKNLVPQARQRLEAHTALNPETGAVECPWFVLDRADMKYGKEGICLPGELYNPWFVETDHEETMVWPDLFLLARNGWELPVYGSRMAAALTGVDLLGGIFLGPLYVFRAGHGSIDTQDIMMAIANPGGSGKVVRREARIADLAVTAASLFGLELRSTTVGQNLAADL